MLLKDDVVNMSKPFRSPRTALAVAAAAGLALAGCTQSPAKHDDRLTKAAGISRVTIVCSKDLWNETKPDGKNISNGPAITVKATVSGIATGPRANRGLVEVSMTGTNLVAYLKELDANAHASKWNNTPKNAAASRRVYDAIAPAIDRIKAASSPNDPEPEIVIDDTIPEKV
ncbi:hypothetical protein PUR49_01160 [Streptomyces sp. BE147]|uniref:hypothetical protein n=1 Tax=Streptomyces sp. BE147 TaxID=3002524 RepID=UPI002E767EE9|nr:hypothetical protein [Streptomyces sp. BE147]MEE1735159.1 hypothetical protein [Streptomyces sp. BE147]